MRKLRPSSSIKIIVGFIFKEAEFFKKAMLSLTKKLGPINMESTLFLFDHTDYYAAEMGSGLKRRFLSFKNLKRADGIYKLKLFTNKIEKTLSCSGRRMINIDPGYLTLSKLVLLTTKDYSHRIYLKDGIFAEATLVFRDGSYRPYAWTYPDYRTEEYINFFNDVRMVYLKDLKG